MKLSYHVCIVLGVILLRGTPSIIMELLASFICSEWVRLLLGWSVGLAQLHILAVLDLIANSSYPAVLQLHRVGADRQNQA